jgi:hypothetical protein
MSLAQVADAGSRLFGRSNAATQSGSTRARGGSTESKRLLSSGIIAIGRDLDGQHRPVRETVDNRLGWTCWRAPRRGGRLRLIALIEEAALIDRILRHLGVPTEIPAPRPARAPPLPVGVRDGDGWDDDPSVFHPCSDVPE